MLFFCKKGKQPHNRAGFYWGVPSQTAGGYDWTKPFLSEYDLRRKSEVGKHMMGMIFRTDTFEFLSAKAVNALTVHTVANIVENSELLTTYSWRRMLPTVALALKFDATERVAIGDWKDAKGLSDEAPITLRYAEGKAGKSRTCKLICAAALASLDKDNIHNFDEVSAKQWEAIAAEARAKVESKPLDVKAVWRNPDVGNSGGQGFKTKRSQFNFPKNLGGIRLAPSSRDGSRYCADYQGDSCRADISGCPDRSCPAGLHKCAAVFRSGRTCHMNHPGSQCRFTKRHAGTQEVNLEDGPALKKAKIEEPEDHPERQEDDQPQAKKARVTPKEAQQVIETSQQDYVDDDSIMQHLLPELRQDRFSRRGNRLQPEPTEERMDVITETTHSIQIYCFANDPIAVQVEHGGESGRYIPGTLVFRCEMSNNKARGADMRALMPCLVNSLRQGDNAYVHCVSGLSRAPVAAGVMGAKLMGISLRKSKQIIDQTRNVKSERGMEVPWIDDVLHEDMPEAPIPTGFSCRVTHPSHVVVHATAAGKHGTGPLCRWKKGAAGQKTFKSCTMTVSSLEEAATEFRGKFCTTCEPLLKASLRVQIRELWAD